MSSCNECRTSCHCGRKNLEIWARRRIARWHPKVGENIFFNIETENNRKVKIPMNIYIYNFPMHRGTLPVMCIPCDKLLVKKAEQDIICSSKSRIKIWFKLLLVVQFEGDKFDTVILPDDIGAKACYAGEIIFPIKFGNNETLEEADVPGTGETAYLWMKDIPFTDPNWEGEIPKDVFSSDTLQSQIVIKSSKILFNTKECCKCREALTDIEATPVELSAIANMAYEFSIQEYIRIKGTPIDDPTYPDYPRH